MTDRQPRDKGQETEDTACAYLERHGLRCVARNYRSRRGEIDLIMRDGDELVFVEVRYRRQTFWGEAAATVTRSKQRRLIAAADHFLQRRQLDCPCRFDVLAFDGERIEWIVNAIDDCQGH